jgi:hypothetical protein
MSPPPLSLWSRSDWAKRHSEIAKSVGHLPSQNSFSGDCQREVADGLPLPTPGHVEMDDAEGAGIPPSVLDQLLSDTYHDPTSAPGDYWNDTNGRSRQPCNYETPGRSDPMYAHHADMVAGPDMSISLSETDFEREDQASSISEHGGTNSQACYTVGSAPAEEPTAADDYAVGSALEEESTAAADYAVGCAPEEEPTAAADCNEVTSAAGSYYLPEDPLQAGRYAAGVEYWRVEDSPGLEEGELSDVPPLGSPTARAQHQRTEDTPPAVTPEADSQCGQPDNSRIADSPPAVTPEADSQCGQRDDSRIAGSRPAARHNARTLPPRNSFPGLRFRPGCKASRQFLSQGMGHPAVHQGPSNGWIEDDDY